MTSTATAYSHTPLALAPLLAALVLLALLLALSLYSLGWTPLAPVQSLLGLHEMAAFKLSSLAESVGLQGLGNVDWNQVQQQDSVHKGKGTHAAGTTGSTTISSGRFFSLALPTAHSSRLPVSPPPPPRPRLSVHQHQGSTPVYSMSRETSATSTLRSKSVALLVGARLQHRSSLVLRPPVNGFPPSFDVLPPTTVLPLHLRNSHTSNHRPPSRSHLSQHPFHLHLTTCPSPSRSSSNSPR